jgi:very-short-patch-repair endonuclease
MQVDRPLFEAVPSSSFLEYAFLRWVLDPAVERSALPQVLSQREVRVGGRDYRIDFEIQGRDHLYAVELDGFAFHSNRDAFTYDRLRQNDLVAAGRTVIRFSYDAVRQDTARCVTQLQELLRQDPRLAPLLVPNPVITKPNMDPDPAHALDPSPRRLHRMSSSYFDTVRGKIDRKTMRECQVEAFSALTNYYTNGGLRAACVMSVGAVRQRLG